MEEESRMMLRNKIAALITGLLVFLCSMAGAQGQDEVFPDNDWQVVDSSEAGHTWDLDRASLMQRGQGRVAGFRETMPDHSYKLTLALFMPDRRMAPIMKLSVTADNTITERWRAEKEEWVPIEKGTPLEKIYEAVWAAQVTQKVPAKETPQKQKQA
jgi:hypothetical protein